MAARLVRSCLHRVAAPESPLLQLYCQKKNSGCKRNVSSTTLDPAVFYKALQDSGVEFFAGVPDSLLKDFCAYVTLTAPIKNHFITANEGNAVAMCVGYHLATKKTGLVYLQNSGLGNTVNPLVSLASPDITRVPILLLIGWRGEPGFKDEPQHVTQGRIMINMLNAMEIPSRVLPTEEAEMRKVLGEAKQYFAEKSAPFGLIVKTKTFSSCKLPSQSPQFPLSREEALNRVVSLIPAKDPIVSTTGMLSRELFEYRVKHRMGHERDFLTVGAMGHASSVALAIALSKPTKQVMALDGDGAILMHMGVFATIGQRAPCNFRHVIFNNGAHDSVGGQPTSASNHKGLHFTDIATACGYNDAFVAVTPEEVEEGMHRMLHQPGPVLMEVKVRLGSRPDLGRPTRTTHENKYDFQSFLNS